MSVMGQSWCHSSFYVSSSFLDPRCKSKSLSGKGSQAKAEPMMALTVSILRWVKAGHMAKSYDTGAGEIISSPRSLI